MTDDRPSKARPRSRDPTRTPTAPGTFPVVAIGASAGGLDACRKFLDSLPAHLGMAYILVQHLDPTHESMMVELLTSHTAMTVTQACDGMPITPDHLYVIPPGTSLSVDAGQLHLAQPQARHGARLPFDILLQSLATDYGTRAICVILSGTGSDGTVGVTAIRAHGGHVIAQDPLEAEYEGMPRNAIASGLVDAVLPVARIPEALIAHLARLPEVRAPAVATDPLADIITLLRARTPHDFTLYKRGTLQRRIERRMGMLGLGVADLGLYRATLEDDSNELEQLSKDLLINVTSFFRDPSVFDYLATHIIPDLVHHQPPDRPIRIWIAGCSTGEETYTLAILFREAILAAKRNITLQMFASDVDPDAIATARDGFYPETIAADVSPERLAHFFSKEGQGYRVAPELRAVVVFTEQDLLADPPFSRLDLVSCRNLLIYLRPEAQAQVIGLFDFALRSGGILLLGTAEAVASGDERFTVIAKPERLYRHSGRSRPGEYGFAISDGVRLPLRQGQGATRVRPSAFAEIARRAVLESYAPACVLINRNHACLYSLGPIDRFLNVALGHPTHDLLPNARPGVRTMLRSALHQAEETGRRAIVGGGRMTLGGETIAFRIDAQPIVEEGESLLLVCFIEEAASPAKPSGPPAPGDAPRIAQLEAELEATRGALQDAIRNLELSSEEQKAVNEEALSVNEEFQSTNEELLTSKEELQSLNEELTALNSQLQETLDRQRTTTNDLQNVLYSTDVATLFLDSNLNIRFFTPATRMLFNVIPGDVGRPLADLRSLAIDAALLADAADVVRTATPIEREIRSASDEWYLRRILPYRTQNDGIEGVVITFIDITDRRHTADALQTSKRQAELANAAKSRFLAAASHDLRQPLQTLALLQGLLAKLVEGERAKALVGRVDETLVAISSMLNTLLDINQIDSGIVHADVVRFPINDLLESLRDEFSFHAHAQNLAFRVVPCDLMIESDLQLLGQMLRNLLSNALKYTKRGKVLLGCRRRPGILSVEVWDTGIGIPDSEIHAVFEEYHQIDNAARERSRGLGLGLSIVQRLGKLLGHPIRVRSRPGYGSMFAIDIALPAAGMARSRPSTGLRVAADESSEIRRAGTILVVENDTELRVLLEQLLTEEGHRVTTAADGVAALALVKGGAIRPDLVLTDYNLPNGLDGLQFTVRLREKMRQATPVIILTGDISTGTLREIARQNCLHLNKPVKLNELTRAITACLASERPDDGVAPVAGPAPIDKSPTLDGQPVIVVVDDDDQIRSTMRVVLEDEGMAVEDYPDGESFLSAERPGGDGCLLIDAYLPGMNGLELLKRLREDGMQLPAIMITGNSDVPMAVQAMKAGAIDFIEKPVGRIELLASVARALELSRDSSKLTAWREDAATHVAGLTPRQREIMDLVLAGHPSKNIAADLGISQRTVENHRASIMQRTGSKSLPALARLALAAASQSGS